MRLADETTQQGCSLMKMPQAEHSVTSEAC